MIIFELISWKEYSIEENLPAKLKEHGMEGDEFFDIVEEEFDIHYKDPEDKKKTITVICQSGV